MFFVYIIYIIMYTEWSYNFFNVSAIKGIAEGLNKINFFNKEPIVLCIGSDLVLGDSLGPLVGTLVKQMGCNFYVYGTLNSTVTAKEMIYVKNYLSKLHPNSFLIVVDAAIGEEKDVGLIKLLKYGIRPGKGVDKNFEEIGDASIIGVVASKSLKNYNLFKSTRLNVVYQMAEKIACGIKHYLKEYKKGTI